jgi:hypothetical protein
MMVPDRSHMAVGMQVVGLDGVPVGLVRDVRDEDFLIDRPTQLDVCLTYDAVKLVTEGQVVLKVPADEVDYTPWTTLAGGATESGGTRSDLDIRAGMTVVGPDMNHIGTVKEIGRNAFHVDRMLDRDIYVPYDAVQSIVANGVVLRISADQVDHMGRDYPPLTNP